MADFSQPSGQAYTGPAAVGTWVEIELVDLSGQKERLTLDIVPDQAADFSAGFLGASTPLARTILGRRAGAVLPYRLADMAEVRILSVGASQRTPKADAAADRESVAREAVNRSDLEDIVRLALTVDVKWGAYDPEGIEAHWNDETPTKNSE